jgi:hypothetical protein
MLWGLDDRFPALDDEELRIAVHRPDGQPVVADEWLRLVPRGWR